MEITAFDMLSFQLASWEGDGMKIVVRSNETCLDCGILFKESNGFRCDVHRRGTERVYLDITGVKGGRRKIYKDRDGHVLHRFTVFSLKDRIVREIERGVFNVKDYLPRHKERFRFEAYSQTYLMDQQRRAGLDPGHEGWLSRSGFEDIRKAQKFFGFFAEMDIQEIRKPQIADWLVSLECSRNQKRKLVGSLGHILRWAHGREDLKTVPVLPLITAPKKKKAGLTQDQQAAILARIPEGMTRWILSWAMESGRRINEYRATRVQDVVFSRAAYILAGAFDMEVWKPFPKVEGHAGREFPLTPLMAEVARKALAARPQLIGPSDYLFVMEGAAKPYTDSVLRKLFTRAATLAGIRCTLNEFGRHSMGKQLREAGATYSDIADILDNGEAVARSNYTSMDVVKKGKIVGLKISHGQPTDRLAKG